MDELFSRFWNEMVGRIGGPMSLRLWLQPTMAAIFAIRDGLKDAKYDRSPYFWALFTSPGHRKEMIKDGWKSIVKIFVLAAILDLVYQLIVFHWVYPFQLLLVPSLLAIVPYLLIRGPVNRLARLRTRPTVQG